MARRRGRPAPSRLLADDENSISDRDARLLAAIQRRAQQHPTDADLAREAELRRPAAAGFPVREGCFGKRRYDSQDRALAVLRERQSYETARLRTYDCVACGGWHLTKAAS